MSAENTSGLLSIFAFWTRLILLDMYSNRFCSYENSWWLDNKALKMNVTIGVEHEHHNDACDDWDYLWKSVCAAHTLMWLFAFMTQVLKSEEEKGL